MSSSLGLAKSGISPYCVSGLSSSGSEKVEVVWETTIPDVTSFCRNPEATETTSQWREDVPPLGCAEEATHLLQREVAFLLKMFHRKLPQTVWGLFFPLFHSSAIKEPWSWPALIRRRSGPTTTVLTVTVWKRGALMRTCCRCTSLLSIKPLNSIGSREITRFSEDVQKVYAHDSTSNFLLGDWHTWPHAVQARKVRWS